MLFTNNAIRLYSEMYLKLMYISLNRLFVFATIISSCPFKITLITHNFSLKRTRQHCVYKHAPLTRSLQLTASTLSAEFHFKYVVHANVERVTSAQWEVCGWRRSLSPHWCVRVVIQGTRTTFHKHTSTFSQTQAHTLTCKSHYTHEHTHSITVCIYLSQNCVSPHRG